MSATVKLFLLLIGASFCKSNEKTNSVAPHAISRILSEYFEHNWQKVDVIHFKDQTGACDQIVDKILSVDNLSLSLKVSVKDAPFKFQLVTSSVLIFDSVKIFKEFHKIILWFSNIRFRHKHLVYIHEGTSKDIEDDISDSIKKLFYFDSVSFLVNEDKESIELITSFMYSPHACRASQLVTINRFLKRTMKWETSDFYPKKYEDFHGCALTVAKLAMLLEIKKGETKKFFYSVKSFANVYLFIHKF